MQIKTTLIALIATLFINPTTQCSSFRKFSHTARYFILARSMSSRGGRWIYDSSGDRIIGKNPNYKPPKKKKKPEEKKEWNSTGDWFKKEKNPYKK